MEIQVYREKLATINGFLSIGIFQKDQFIMGNQDLFAIYQYLNRGILSTLCLARDDDFPESILLETSEKMILIDYDHSFDLILLMLFEEGGDYEVGCDFLRYLKETIVAEQSAI